jgi:hypothetical protein
MNPLKLNLPGVLYGFKLAEFQGVENIRGRKNEVINKMCNYFDDLKNIGEANL